MNNLLIECLQPSVVTVNISLVMQLQQTWVNALNIVTVHRALAEVQLCDVFSTHNGGLRIEFFLLTCRHIFSVPFTMFSPEIFLTFGQNFFDSSMSSIV